jgi:DNA repair exonuclease SbcCD ATPase subunit
MKEIKLQKIQLSNFKSLNIEVEFNNDTTKISGKNGLGKTSIASAFYWLLSSYTSPFVPKNFALFDDRVELTHETPLAKVKAWLKVGDYEYTIEKTAEAKFTRSKGSSEWVKASSDTYTVYIDEIETSATHYNEWIEANICPVAMLPYLLSGEFFTALIDDNKNKAREILSLLVGEVKEEDFKGDYSSIAELMTRYSAGDIVEMSKKKKKPLEERQNVIPVEIDRKEERLSELKSMDFSATESEIEKIKREIEAIDGLLLGNAEAVKPILEHNREIENKVANKRLSLANGRLDYKEAQSARTSEIKAKIAEIKRYNEGVYKENAKIVRDFEEKKENKEALSKRYDTLKDYLDTLRNKKNEIKCRVFTEDHCPYCGAELDPMELETKKIAFNEAKEMELKVIIEEGKSRKEELDKLKAKIDGLGQEIEAGYTPIEWQDITPYEEALARVESTFIPYEETDEFKRINAEIDTLMSEIKEVPSNDNESLTNRKKGLVESLSEFSKKLGLKDEIGKTEKDIEELRKELRSIANSIAELEGMIFKCAEWIQERNEIVSHRINDKLSKSRIDMWSKQKNGDLVPDLVLCNHKGVKFNSTNFANRIEIMLDLQLMFNKLFDVNIPIFIDESAVFSPSNLPKFEDTQVVYLFASDEETLTVR